jgi:crotonobetainyl-CoA:carnitine CoA-transferase CaiB-like acyl-CoA transferase
MIPRLRAAAILVAEVLQWLDGFWISNARESIMEELFGDLLVIDCASFIAGPAAATILSDFGARVIKVEPPGSGDNYRQLLGLPGMPVADRDYFWILDNRNKESLALDLKHEAARTVIEALIRKADVFITNFPGPIRKRLGLRAEDVMPLNDRLIYASLTPYGEEGEEKDRTGFDTTAWWARSGLMDIVRATPETEPGLSVPGMGDHPTAATLFGAIAAALYRREKTGKGGSVSTSLLANGIWSNACWTQAALCDADFSAKLQRGQRSALTEFYRCRCGRWFLLVMVNHQREWPLLVHAIGRPEWLADSRFVTPEARREHTAELVKALEDIFIRRDWTEWRAIFESAGITFGPISRPADHLNCPQIAANGLLPEIVGTAGLRTVDSPIFIDGISKRQPSMAPTIGEHTRPILKGLGYDDAAIEALLSSGTVQCLR